MMHFNIINPSDPYTMRAVDLEVAAVAVGVLGVGQYGLEEIGGDRSGVVPMFISGGHDEWYTKQFGRNFSDTLNHVLNHRHDELVKALASVHLGTPADKAAFDERAARCADPEAVVELLHELHDAKRTSDNDIGRRAWQMAQALVEQRMAREAAVAEATEQAAGLVVH
jgi:hypothetical protein